MKLRLKTRNTAMLAWVLLLIAVPTGLYVAHVYDQLQEVRENNLRTLSKAADSINRTLGTALENVRNLQNNESFVCEFLERQPYLEWGGDGVCTPVSGDEEREPSSESDIEIEQLETAPEDIIEFINASLEPGFEALQAVVSDAAGTERYRFEVDFGALLSAIPFSDAIDVLFVADSDGHVIHQHRPAERQASGLLISSLSGLPRGSEDVLDIEDLKRSSSISKVRLANVDFELLCQPLTLGLISGDTTTSGDPDTHDDHSFSENTWVLCGLAESERSLRSALAVAPFLAIAFVAVTIFGIFTWPGIKLLWMTSRDRLYFADLVYLFFGTLGALMLATTLILGYGNYRSLVALSDSELESLAERLEDNLTEEIVGVTVALKAMDEAFSVFAEAAPQSYRGRLADISDFYSNQLPSGSVAMGAKNALREALVEANQWPIESDFEMAFWADCRGLQHFKTTIKRENTPRVNIGRRAYYRLAVNAPAVPEGRPGFVEPVRSVTTSKFATIVSIPSKVDTDWLAELATRSPEEREDDYLPQCGTKGIAAAQVKLVSTTDTVLPPGFGFAVVDENGTALLHSDESRALFENLFEEMDSGERIRSIALARNPQTIKTSYLGRSYRAHVTPMKDLPWTLITFTDAEMVTTANLETIGNTAIIVLLYLLFNALLGFLYFLWKGPLIPPWLWPGSHIDSIRGWSLGIPAAVLACMLAWVAWQDGDHDTVVGSVFLVPFVIFGAIYVAYGRVFGREAEKYKCSDVEPAQVRASIASSLMVWIAAGVLPTYCFFEQSMNMQNRLLVRYENERIASQLAERNCAIDAAFIGVDREALGDGPKAARRSLSARDLYPTSILAGEAVADGDDRRARLSTEVADTEACGSAPDDRGNSLWRLLSRAKPIYNTTTAESRYLAPGDSAQLARSTCWSWSEPEKSSGTAFELAAAPLACGTRVKISSWLPEDIEDDSLPVVPLFSVLMLLALVSWTRYGARRVFFGNLKTPPLKNRSELENSLALNANDSKTRLVLVSASQYDRSLFLDPDADENDTSQPIPQEGYGEYSRYDLMDYLSGSSARDRLLTKLTEDIKAKRNILLVSPMDPYEILARGVEDEPAPAASNDEKTSATDTTVLRAMAEKREAERKWRSLLAQFRVVIVSVNKYPPNMGPLGNLERGRDRPMTEAYLATELAALPELKPLREILERELHVKEEDRSEAPTTMGAGLERVVERAYGNYMALWDACTEDEKLVLVQLANEKVVNPKQESTVRGLIQRGLLVRDPGLRVLSPSFGLFIQQIQDPEEVKSWEQDAAGLSWVHARWVVLGFLSLGLLFLWATQRDLFNTTMMFLSAAAVSVPGIIKLMSNLSKATTPGNS